MKNNYVLTVICLLFILLSCSPNSETVTITSDDIDPIPPTVNTFTTPPTSTTLTVPITAFTASDNIQVTGYLANESSAKPSPTAAGWSFTAPISYTFGSSGTKTLYSWAKDKAGNVSAYKSASVTIDTASPPGATDWAERLGGTSPDIAYSVATDNNGNIVIAGTFTGTTDFGRGILTSYGGSSDIFVAKFDAAGNCLWSKSFGNSGVEVANAAAVDGAGNVIITGYFQGTGDFGGGVKTSVYNSRDIFIAKYNGATGDHIWSKSFGYAAEDTGYGLAVDSRDDSVIVTGRFAGVVDFGGGYYLQSDGGTWDTFVAKYRSDGVHVWSKNFLSDSPDQGYGVATDRSGNVFVTGTFMGSVDFGAGYLTSASLSYDVFLAKLDSAGNYKWARRFGNTGSDIGYSVAADNGGNVVVTGSFYGAVDFGGGLHASAGLGDIFVAKYDTDGNYLWSDSMGGTGLDVAYGVGVDRVTNEVVITGYFQGSVNFGGGLLTSFGSDDIFVAKYDGLTGSHIWSKEFGDTVIDRGTAVAIDTIGNVLLSGYFKGIADFGSGPLTSAGGSYDTFLLKLKP